MTKGSRTVYVNGEFVSESSASISIFDRGLLFGDAIYEVWSVLDGKLIDSNAHLARLHRCLGEVGIEQPISDGEILSVAKELVARNCVEEGLVYMQVTRGVADRDFLPPDEITPTIFSFSQARPVANSKASRDGLRVITMPEIRWQRRDIKSTILLASCLAKTAAHGAGVDDAWFVEDGYITEGTSNNAHIISRSDEIITRPISNEILAGCTRAAVLRLADENGLKVEERAFTVEETYRAAEAFITSASMLVTGVVEIDGNRLSNGKPGVLTGRLRETYIEMAQETAV